MATDDGRRRLRRELAALPDGGAASSFDDRRPRR
jgi:hypothetical protein